MQGLRLARPGRPGFGPADHQRAPLPPDLAVGAPGPRDVAQKVDHLPAHLLLVERADPGSDHQLDPGQPFFGLGLLLRSSVIGTVVGVIPGIGGTVASFVAYASASQTAGREGRFGEGNIRGVLAPEAANDAEDGGALLPVVVFGIPGNEGTALLLAAMIIHGLAPGPELPSESLPLMFAIIWSLLLANWLTSLLGLAGAGLCARITVVPLGLLAPVLLGLVALGALSLRGEFSDLLLVVLFGLFGYAPKLFDWPRPPFVIAFVLGGLFERQLHLTLQLVDYGRIRILERPVAMVLALLIATTVVRGLARGQLATLLLLVWTIGASLAIPAFVALRLRLLGRTSLPAALSGGLTMVLPLELARLSGVRLPEGAIAACLPGLQEALPGFSG